MDVNDRGVASRLRSAGRAIGEPVVFAGPFALSSRDRVEDAAARFRRGEMGRL